MATSMQTEDPLKSSSPQASAECACDSPDELLWTQMDVNLDALDGIVGRHFQCGITDRSRLKEGYYARVFLYTLQDDRQIVARISLPVRPLLKTEAEVSAMRMIKARTAVPVPDVYLYCSCPDNPVGAEWVLMEYLPGARLGDCFDKLGYRQKYRLATDMAEVMAALFRITSSHLGSILKEYEPKDETDLRLMAGSRYSQEWNAPVFPESSQTSVDGRFLIGPINDASFLDYPNQVPSEDCGPFMSERDFLVACAFHHRASMDRNCKSGRWSFARVLEIYDAVRPLYTGFNKSSQSDSVFHFAHGDVSRANILVNVETGAITGVLDWEMSGFRPAWLSCQAAGWFDDDLERFLMCDWQDGRGDYEHQSVLDGQLRAHFRTSMAAASEDLFRHYWLGVELRAIFYAAAHDGPGNAQVWIQKYAAHEWPVARRGPFPFDVDEWIWNLCGLATKCIRHVGHQLGQGTECCCDIADA